MVATIDGTGSTISQTIPLTTAGWAHAWMDVTPFQGQTVTVCLGFDAPAGQKVYLDEISAGDASAGVYLSYLPVMTR
jgi:hypothetical protein